MKKKKLLISVIAAEIVIILAAAGLIIWMSMPKGAQQVEDLSHYTWEDFSAMTDQEKLAFSQKFDGDDFEKWLEEVSPQETTPNAIMPWEQGGKLPDTYTWAEYEALTPEEQMGFFNWFDSIESFDKWMNRANPQETEPTGAMPWEQGGKQPDAYTWEEYQALTAEQQIAFFNWFDSAESFDNWMDRAKPKESVPEDAIPWEQGGKQPDAYTWEEYQALTAEQQIAFFDWFDAAEDFDEWMDRVKKQEAVPEDAMPWERGGKLPDAYTWEEYEALTAEQQMKFFYWFDSVEDFDAWMVAAQNP